MQKVGRHGETMMRSAWCMHWYVEWSFERLWQSGSQSVVCNLFSIDLFSFNC